MSKRKLSAQQKHDNTYYKLVENEKENLTVFLSGLDFKTRTAVYKLTAYKLLVNTIAQKKTEFFVKYK